MNLVLERTNEINGRVVRGPVNCAMCEKSTKIGFKHGIMIICIHCHFEVMEQTSWQQ